MATSIATQIDVPITVNAWGTAAGGRSPHFKLLIDGNVVGEADVSATSSAPYAFQANVNPDEPHEVAVWYDNDAMDRPSPDSRDMLVAPGCRP